MQTMARVWDALLSEGPKILYRVALVLLKDAAPEALAADNPGDLITAIKTSCHTCHDRDALMKVAPAVPACLSVLVLLKDAAPEALAADNPADLITAIKTSSHTCHDRDALMKVALAGMLCQPVSPRWCC